MVCGGFMSQNEMNWDELLNKIKQLPSQQQRMLYEVVSMASKFEQEVSTFELWRRASFIAHNAEHGRHGNPDEIEYLI
jgi:hypothetical protein